MSIEVKNVDAKSLLNPATGFIKEYDFTLNPYRGCQYGCSYCYAAAFSPNRDQRQDWGNWVIVKQNAIQLLEKELIRWYKKHPNLPPKIYMSSVTDPYQPVEAKRKLTQGLLRIMLPYQPTLVIQTRSPLILRDMDLLKQFQKLRINMSIPTGSETVKKDFEGRSPSVKARLQTMGKLKHNIPCNGDHDIRFSITITPLLPTFPEDQEQFVQQLAIVDRVVIQDFHPNKSKSLTASTRLEAMTLKRQYSWWYDRAEENYQNFKAKLTTLCFHGVEILEGKAGFGYD